MSTSEDFEADVRCHDAQIASLGLTIWVGSEPTFTDRVAQAPEWLSQALGGDKEQRAKALLSGLCRRFPGGLVLRSVGRQYPGEGRPRWNLGLYRRRNGEPIWHGPLDPILAEPRLETPPDLDAWAAALAAELEARGFSVSTVTTSDARERRLLMRANADVPVPDADDPRLTRSSVHASATPPSGLRDDLAEAGAYLLILSLQVSEGWPAPCVELPMLASVELYLAALKSVAQASVTSYVPTLILAGYPPPVDASMEWTTVTPDPAVIEINTAPSIDAEDFLCLLYTSDAADE